jgi:hypothetical protein
MVVEILYPNQVWPINLPTEPPRDRPLEAFSASTGDVMARWDGTQDDCGRWLVRSYRPGTGRNWWRWHEIVGVCMERDWSLRSLPLEADHA